MASRWPWIKVAVELPDEEKFVGRPEKWRDIGIWVALLCKAQKSPIRGSLYLSTSRPVTPQWLCDYFGLSRQDIDELLSFFHENEMITEDERGGLVVIHFFERQYDKPSDRPEATRGRQQRSRSRHAKSRRESETDSDTDEDTVPPTPRPVDNRRLQEDDEEDAFLKYKNRVRLLLEGAFGKGVDAGAVTMFATDLWNEGVEYELIAEGVKIAKDRGEDPVRYFGGMVNHWLANGIKTVEQANQRRRGRA